jgi:hypothetical protein
VIVVVPAETPVIIPLESFIVAIPVTLLLQVPALVSVSVEFVPGQTEALPEIEDNGLLIVSVAVARQPLPVENVIIVVPMLIPETIPKETSIVATAGLPLVQVPAPDSESVTEEPIHIFPDAEIAEGIKLTVAVIKATDPQPVE